jgi:hypothetical protein
MVNDLRSPQFEPISPALQSVDVPSVKAAPALGGGGELAPAIALNVIPSTTRLMEA